MSTLTETAPRVSQVEHTPCYARAIESLTRAVVDAEYAGTREASMALMSLRYVLLDDRLSHEPGLDTHEASLWSFQAAEQLVENYRTSQIVEVNA